MKKGTSIFLMAVFSLILFNQNLNGQSCVYCNSNTVGDSSSAIGAENISTGEYSLTSGLNNESTGQQSHTFGYGNIALEYSSFAAGLLNTSNGIGSVCFGNSSSTYGRGSFAAGIESNANGVASFAFGQNVKTGPASYNSYVFGKHDNHVIYGWFSQYIPHIFCGAVWRKI